MNTNAQTENGFALPDPLAGHSLGAGSPGASTLGAGVASLDTPLVQQTKAEIRTLAADIAGLAHSAVSPSDFFEGFLPRLCVAMGATGAGVWDVRATDQPRLIANHGLPGSLLEGDQPTAPHAAILACTMADGQPILVPPRTVTVDADRPKNPLDDALIVVPVRVEENVEYAVEVVQPPSGGPAAQRGYLRFIAQMCDLMADYLRRQALRELSEHRRRLQCLRGWLLQVAKQTDFRDRAIITAEALAELLEAEQVLLVEGHHAPKLLAISGVRHIDPRSEIVLAAKRWARMSNLSFQELAGREPSPFEPSHVEKSTDDLKWYIPTDRRESATSTSSAAPEPSSQQEQIDTLCDLLQCRRLLALELHAASRQLALVGFAATTGPSSQRSEDWESDAGEIAQSFGALLAMRKMNVWLPWSWNPWANPSAQLGAAGSRTVFDRVRVWVTRIAICGLLFALAIFPVPQQFSATAILQPSVKSIFFAPVESVVSEVKVKEGERVDKLTPLVQLKSRELESDIDRLEGELRLHQDRLDALAKLRNRGVDLTSRERDRLEAEMEQLQISQQTDTSRLQLLKEREKELLVLADGPGTVATWNVENQLKNKPVEPGDVLLTTYEPDGSWQLELAVPDYRVGDIAAAIERAQAKDARSGANVSFSLSSHPAQLLNARLVKLASYATTRPRQDGMDDSRMVIGLADLDASLLPLKKDGAVARATIECGTVPAIWLVLRDAVRALSSRAQMLW